MIDGIHPYLNFAGQASDAIQFYAEALGAEVEGVSRWGEMPGEAVPAAMADRVMHACIRVGENMRIMMSDLPPGREVTAGNAYNVMLQFPDASRIDQVFAALAEGGTVEMPLEDTFWGARFGKVVDRFGVAWMLNATLPQQG